MTAYLRPHFPVKPPIFSCLGTGCGQHFQLDHHSFMIADGVTTRSGNKIKTTRPNTRIGNQLAPPHSLFPQRGKLLPGRNLITPKFISSLPLRVSERLLLVLAKGDRIFYVPDEDKLKVVVFYAGKHIQPAPIP